MFPYLAFLLGSTYYLLLNLTLRKIVVERVTAVKFGVDKRSSDGTGF